MFEKLTAKLKEIGTSIDKRFNLSGQYGPVSFAKDVELSARVVSSKISQEWVKFADAPKEYLSEKLEVAKNKIEEIKNKLAKKDGIKPSFAEKLANWFRDRAEDVYSIPEKVTKTRELWEIEKLRVVDTKLNPDIAIALVYRVDELNKKRVEYKNRAEKQHQANVQLRYAYQI